MARKTNELFIGEEYLNIEGRAIKHPALIKLYANLNINKISDKPIDLIGLDLETNHLTSELKLLGVYDGKQYQSYTDNLLKVFLSHVIYCEKRSKAIAYWSKLDPQILFKQFLYLMEEKDIENSMEQFGKVSGEWDKKEGKWKLPPVCEVKIGRYHFGIRNAIRSSIQFFYYKSGDTFLHTVWAYDIKQLYENNLEKEALGDLDELTNTYPNARLKYYSKVEESAHLVDWERFKIDPEYHKLVLYSNELDSRAVHDLGYIIQEQFLEVFKKYPKTLISTGSLARSGIVANIYNKLEPLYPDETILNSKVNEEVKSISLITFKDKYLSQLGSEQFKDFYAMTFESYSGGYIESVRYGFAEECYTADITSAYPDTIKDLYDLRNSIITHGEGEPPHIKFSYCFIRGTVNIPMGTNYHPITIKHFLHKETNIRAVGEYVASYTIEERDYLLTLGATFKDEKWFNIETEGKLSPLAEACNDFYNLRMKLRAEENTAQYMAKIAMNSLYGILFEAVDTYELNDLDEIIRVGYRAGEFLNSVYASTITSRTRILLSKASNEIESRGGKVALLMTDSLFWTGTADMLPLNLWTEKKTIGYFEKPELIKNFISLGAGRYEFSKLNYKTNIWEKLTSKKRGLNAVDIHDPEGVLVKGFSWLKALQLMKHNKSESIAIKVKVLVTVGVVKSNPNKYSWRDLGLVADEIRNVEAIVGKNKRNYSDDLKNPSILIKQLVDTEPLVVGFGMNGIAEHHDQSLPKLRAMMMKLDVKTTKEKRDITVRRASKKYYESNNPEIKRIRKERYQMLREHGYSVQESRSMCKWAFERITETLQKEGKI